MKCYLNLMQFNAHIFCFFFKVYGDFPASRKVTETGSACPQCYTPEEEFNRVEDCPLALRSSRTDKRRKRDLLAAHNVPRAKKIARY